MSLLRHAVANDLAIENVQSGEQTLPAGMLGASVAKKKRLSRLRKFPFRFSPIEVRPQSRSRLVPVG